MDAAVKDGIKRMINGLEDGNLGVFGSLREPPSLRGEQPTSPSASPLAASRLYARHNRRAPRRQDRQVDPDAGNAGGVSSTLVGFCRPRRKEGSRREKHALRVPSSLRGEQPTSPSASPFAAWRLGAQPYFTGRWEVRLRRRNRRLATQPTFPSSLLPVKNTVRAKLEPG